MTIRQISLLSAAPAAAASAAAAGAVAIKQFTD